ncbi:Dihydrolipoamide dehydrogenase of pyruvate dehydrogenase complex [hydrothermal vent metagenome]|uniref:Dihydrolipoamide dehydrogenase of pyruvate dehydrogenase complex n=1 Tax=hydrothermal vent metagenome TaxID=652676 RepID=A0A3B0U9T2_9ZZZZ
MPQLGLHPTKALLRSAEIYDYMKHARAYGLKCDNPGIDFTAIVDRSRKVSKQLAGGVSHLLKKNKVTVLEGRGVLKSAGVVTVTGKAAGDYAAKHIIVATGARPRAAPGLEPDGKLVWTYFEALKPDALPKKLLVIGSGAIGIEFASFYHSMGAEVTVVEVMDQIMPVEDADISALARKAMEKRGLNIITSAKVTGLKRGANDVTATVEDAKGVKTDIKIDRVISAVGVEGNIEDLGLEALGVKTDRGCITIDGFGRTNVPGIYAIGDVAGPPMLAHKAEHEGAICVEAIAGLNPHAMDKLKIPGCTYCNPSVASVGLTEAAARAAGHKVKVGKFPFIGNGKAIALGEPEGMVKTVFDAKTGQLLGAHMVGAEVTELIQGFVIAMGLETTEEDLMHAVFPHPTLSEMMHESVLAAYGRAIHF